LRSRWTRIWCTCSSRWWCRWWCARAGQWPARCTTAHANQVVHLLECVAATRLFHHCKIQSRLVVRARHTHSNEHGGLAHKRRARMHYTPPISIPVPDVSSGE
jgi:hypothetical protein